MPTKAMGPSVFVQNILFFLLNHLKSKLALRQFPNIDCLNNVHYMCAIPKPDLPIYINM